MAVKNEGYVDAIADYKKEQTDWFALDLLAEIDDIDRTLDTESSKILLNWVRDKILKVRDEYREND